MATEESLEIKNC